MIDLLVKEDDANNNMFTLLQTYLFNHQQKMVTLFDVDTFFIQLLSLLGFSPDISNKDNTLLFSLSEGRFVDKNAHIGPFFEFTDESLSILVNLYDNSLKPLEIKDNEAKEHIHSFILQFFRYHSEMYIRDWKDLKIA